MLRGLSIINISPDQNDPLHGVLKNRISEGRVLHTRNLCNFCTSTLATDIRPSDLFDNYDADPKYKPLREHMKRLAQNYGRRKERSTPRWAFNKMLAHPTKDRGKGFDYSPFLNRVVPILHDIIGELETLRGCPFG
jgi:hypothetical protein